MSRSKNQGYKRSTRSVTNEKAAAQRVHAIRRAKERYGVHLTTADLDRCVAMIQNNQSTVVARQSHRVTAHDVPLGGAAGTVRAVYDSRRKTIVTFLNLWMLPSGWWRVNEEAS